MSDLDGKRFASDIEPWLDRLYRAAYRLTQNRADAEELFQETCVRAFARRADWERTTSPLGWLMRVQYNLFIDELRRRKSSPIMPIAERDFPGLPADASSDPESCANDAETFARVHRAWQLLSKDHRALLALRVEGYTLPEMQEITGLSLAAVNSRLQRARQALARHLNDDRGVAQTPVSMESKR